MAESKTSSSKAAGSNKAAQKSSRATKQASATRTKAKSRAKAGSKSKTRAKAKKPTSRSGSSNGSSKTGVAGGVKAVRDSIGDTGEKVGHATSEAASKAKIPLIAGGAALVGAASGIALSASRASGSKVLGVKMPKTKVKIRSKDLVRSADRVARAGEQIGRLSTGIREIQGTAGSSNGHGQNRSPIEVLIQGLTRRR